ncbi:hypothetical protein K1718_13315 [Roseibium porphyridii]|uniref:Bacteriophage protein n=1 Tax=Roseibium porphyridii TaxID=2866279 RepID=A0ABY8FIA6_9HYPH|nr:hypothetical protein [Roseibium sp. KMA01]WFE92298.1 hypothetical protein K1718_13315 [Roseibium sp. KMA01]
MTALAVDRRTPERSGDRREFSVKASTLIYAGALVAIGADDLAVPMSTATTLQGVGRAEGRVDNSTGADGDLTVSVGSGIYRYANSAAADEITAADIGENCYGVDDQTVALTNGTNTRSVAGKIYDVDAHGVWVDFR